MNKHLPFAALLALLPLCSASAAALDPGQPHLAERLSALGRMASLSEAQVEALAIKTDFGLTPASPQPDKPVPAFVIRGAPVVELVDLRLLLAQIAVQTGAKDHLVLAQAQAPGVHQVILLRGGYVSLSGLRDLLENSPAAAFMTPDAKGFLLTRALVVWPDAGLTLGPKDELVLSRAHGSFLANLGWLDIQGGSVRGTEAPNLGAAVFRPFVLTASRGSLTVSQANFAHLGFGDTQRFGGVSVDNSGLQPPRVPPVVQTSRFEDVAALALINTENAIVKANRIEGGSVLIAHSNRAYVAGNLLNAAPSQSIRVTSTSTDVVIADNIVMGGLAGISVDQASERVSLWGNVLTGQSTSGIRLDKVDCVQVSGNLTALGSGTGLSLSNTGRVAIAGNAIVQNSGSGILLRDQRDKAAVTVTGNQIADNHEGLRGATAGSIKLSGNDLEGQVPRLFSGDMAQRTIGWLEDRRIHGPQPLRADQTPVCLSQRSF